MTTSPSVPKLTLCEVADPGVPGLESYSPFCLKVHRGLKYLGLPYERRHGFPASFKKYHRTGQVPVLLIGDSEAVGDSTDILKRIQVLAGRTFHGTHDPKLEAEAFLWEEFADSTLGGYVPASRFGDEDNYQRTKQAYFAQAPAFLRPAIGAAIRGRIMKGLVARDIWRAGPETCWRRFGELLHALEGRAPEEGYWLGSFSVADISLFGILHSFRTALTPRQHQQVDAHSRLKRYLDRVDAATREPRAQGPGLRAAAQ